MEAGWLFGLLRENDAGAGGVPGGLEETLPYQGSAE